MLDVGADMRADAEDLLQYALMGASYARNALGLARPRVGLLNVGTEEHKGRAEIKAAAELIAAASEAGEFEFIGYVEGSDIPSDRVDVIVTDGFTGNVALKTAEGTARLIRDFLHEAFAYSAAQPHRRLLRPPLAQEPAAADRSAPGQRRRVPRPQRHRGQKPRRRRRDRHRRRGQPRLHLAEIGFTHRLAARVAAFAPRPRRRRGHTPG